MGPIFKSQGPIVKPTPKPTGVPPRTWIVGVRGPDGQAANQIGGRLVRFDGKPDLLGVPSSYLDVQFTLPADLDYGSTYTGHFTAQGCGELETLITATDPLRDPVRIVQLPSGDFDPSGIPLTQLARIRGMMWPKGQFPLGPRPNQPDNIGASDFLYDYTAGDQTALLKFLRDRGMTHAEFGPLVAESYHGNWNGMDWRGNWDGFLDMLQQAWNSGIAPVVFISPNNWSVEQCRAELTPLLQQPRAQKLIRIGVPAGWEPGGGYTMSSVTYANFFQWWREIMPNALCLWHNWVKGDGAAPDAPVGSDAAFADTDNGAGWQRCAPYLHGWLIQSGPFGSRLDQLEDGGRMWRAQFLADGDGAEFHSVAWHFKHGIAGWPTGSAWGPNSPILLYDGESTAYERFWHGGTNEQAATFGDGAVANGAAGYLDGGTAPVGTGLLPW